MKLIHGDCITEMEKLISEGVKVDMVLTDPPYGTIKGLTLNGTKNFKKELVDWDDIIPIKPMFQCCEKLLRVNGTLILFCQEPYSSYLRQFKHPNLPFLYPYYWLKNDFANYLSCKKAPVSYIEDLSVFRKKYDSDNSHPLRIYAQKLLKDLNKNSKDIERDLGHRKAEHFFYKNGSLQFMLCTEDTYNDLINTYHINELPYFKSYDELNKINESYKSKFNIKFKLNGAKVKSNVLKYKKPTNHYHPTEKPVPLLEDLIFTYTDEGDTVLDFTMGSGSTGVACNNTNRDFIGIELDEDYYNIAVKRCKTKQEKLI